MYFSDFDEKAGSKVAYLEGMLSMRKKYDPNGSFKIEELEEIFQELFEDLRKNKEGDK